LLCKSSTAYGSPERKEKNNFDLKMKTKETKDSDKRMTDRFVI
jgi:hypothetical protein